MPVSFRPASRTRRKSPLIGADPAGALGIAVAQLAAAVQRAAVVGGVEEELGLANHAVRPAQLGQQVIDVDHLVGRVRRPSLLAVAEGRVGDENVAGLDGRRIELHRLSVDLFDHRPVEADQRRQAVVERFFQQIGFGAIDQWKGLRFLRHDTPPGWGGCSGVVVAVALPVRLFGPAEGDSPIFAGKNRDSPRERLRFLVSPNPLDTPIFCDEQAPRQDRPLSHGNSAALLRIAIVRSYCRVASCAKSWTGLAEIRASEQ